ncbi:hypothetical protein L596_011901 [Steinernema carpocapsae]|uniref:Nuclear receptor domain-containing protein n=1 Tax=Steinernema carpocapsae TaxID=34508 RepID=A0A4U5NVT2_STECR|nr:hypothetical protein L596_011901 [Steinernema carpocapsae]
MRAVLCQYCVPKDVQPTADQLCLLVSVCCWGKRTKEEKHNKKREEILRMEEEDPTRRSNFLDAATKMLLLSSQASMLSVLHSATNPIACGSRLSAAAVDPGKNSEPNDLQITFDVIEQQRRRSVQSSVGSVGGDDAAETGSDNGSILGFEDTGKGLCQVCGAKSHGAHFQVQTCRACAAFFRRTSANSRVYKCRRAMKNCDVSKNATLNCRFCRFEKCRKVGMKYHKSLDDVPPDVPQTSAAASTTAAAAAAIVDVSRSIKQEVVTPSPADPAPSTVQYENHRALMDTDATYQEIRTIIEGNVINFGPPLGLSAFRLTYLTHMERMKYAYDELFAAESRVKGSSLQQLQKVDIKVILDRTNYSLINYAKFLMASPHFAKLAPEDKWRMFRRATSLFVTFDTAYPTIAAFGYETKDRRIVFNSSFCADVDDFEFCAEGMDQSYQQEIHKNFGRFPQEVIDNLVVPMRRMRITDYELVYLQMLLIWNIRNLPEISDNAKHVANNVIDEISTELDKYYKNELRMSTYATRLVKLCTIQGAMEKYAHRKNDAFNLGETLNTFQCDIYGSRFTIRR